MIPFEVEILAWWIWDAHKERVRPPNWQNRIHRMYDACPLGREMDLRDALREHARQGLSAQA